MSLLSRVAPWAIAAAIAAAAFGCDLIAYADRSLIPSGSGGSGGGGASASASSSGATGGAGGATGSTTGSGGAGIECILPLDCPGTETDCMKKTCVAHHCGTAPVAADTPTSFQLAGDCQREVCDGAGGVKLANDDSDVLVDGNVCTDDTCAAGAPQNLPSKAATPCNVDGGKVCDGFGHCIACFTAQECPGQACVNNVCVAVTCINLMKDGDESDVDCGGLSCQRCPVGKKCGAGSDCAGGACSGGVCQATCTDGEKNQDETGIDCGGVCPPCADAGSSR